MPFGDSLASSAMSIGAMLLLTMLLAACGLPRLDRVVIAPPRPGKAMALEQIALPPGFSIELLSDQVPSARSMTFGDRGTLFVGSKDAGTVYALVYRVGAQSTPLVVASGLDGPHGVAFRDGALYVAETGRILRFDGIETRLREPPPAVPVAELPRYKHHGLRPLRFGPDGALYFAVGAPCNICLPEPGYASLYRLPIGQHGAAPQRIATGVRNSVGLDFDPQSGELWFTDNGRDLLGSAAPADELNRLAADGAHFGYPYCHAGELQDPEFGMRSRCERFVAPAQPLDSHVAALGMRFYTGQMFPIEYRGRIFIAEHGSWNRRPRLGYRITEVEVQDGRAVGYRPFATGWMQGDRVWGRPVDVEVAPDGALLVSDDSQGAIYRISYDRARLSLH